MPKLDEYLTVKEAAEYLGVAKNTMRNWDEAGKVPVYRHPANNYRLFKKKDLEKMLQQIEDSGQYPTGWKHRGRRKRKPR